MPDNTSDAFTEWIAGKLKEAAEEIQPRDVLPEIWAKINPDQRGGTMRVNVYSQEIDLTQAPVLIRQEGEGIDGPATFYGIRFYLHSSDRLHTGEGDDDRSAVTFWLPRNDDKKRLVAALFNQAYHIIVEDAMF